jgi:hypothetical protein
VLWIRTQGYDDKKNEKIQLKKVIFELKIAIYLSLGLGRVVKKKHPALQKIKFITFSQFLLAIFALLDPYPDTRTPLNPYPQH